MKYLVNFSGNRAKKFFSSLSSHTENSKNENRKQIPLTSGKMKQSYGMMLYGKFVNSVSTLPIRSRILSQLNFKADTLYHATNLAPAYGTLVLLHSWKSWSSISPCPSYLIKELLQTPP